MLKYEAFVENRCTILRKKKEPDMRYIAQVKSGFNVRIINERKSYFIGTFESYDDAKKARDAAIVMIERIGIEKFKESIPPSKTEEFKAFWNRLYKDIYSY